MRTFHICTIANNLNQYKEMKTSFIEAGFDEDKCRYSLFDNSNGNIYDPYETFNKVKVETTEPYIIFCHQDILLNKGNGFNDLIKLLDELEKLDSNWAIVGNAGVNQNYEPVAKISDPNNTQIWSGTFPQQVHSLDENFLVIKVITNISCSTDLKGFHFYATDLCLNAIQHGYSCYVIDFHLTHLSTGNLSKAFWDSQKLFYSKWCDRFNFCYVKTTTGVAMCLTKNRIIRAINFQPKVAKLLLYILRLQKLLVLHPQVSIKELI